MNPFRSVSARLHPFRLALVATALVVLAPTAATAQTVRDSIKMTRVPYSWETHEGGGTQCGSGVVALWPDVLAQLPGADPTANRYGSYSRISIGGTRAQGYYIPGGYGQARTNAAAGIAVPMGFLGHNPQLGGSYAGPPDTDGICAKGRAEAAATAAGGGGFDILNGAPFRIGDWYAVFSVASGTPFALFEWKATEPLTIAFDASFASRQSHEVDAAAPGKRVPVASYRWAFGDQSGIGTGDKPMHVYADTGRYLVTLEVTDDDGEKATVNHYVRVTKPGLVVWAEARDAGRTYHRGDTLVVVSHIENRSDGEITNIRVPFQVGFGATYVDSVFAGYRRLNAEYTRLSSRTRSDTTIASLAPGQSVEVLQSYAATTYARFYPVSAYIPTPITGHAFLMGVTGKDANGHPVDVKEKCGIDACGNTWKLGPRVYAFEMTLRAASATGLAAREVSAVPSGLMAGPSGALAVVARHRVRTADLSERVCRSGCVEVEVVVKDDQGQPAKNVEVSLSAPAVPITAGFGAVTPGQTGRFCDPDPVGDGTRCGATLSGFTDAEGRLRSVYLTPGVVSDVPVTLTAKPKDPDNDGSVKRTLTVQPNVVRETTIAVNDETSRALMAALLVRGFSDNSQKLAELPATFCKAVGTTFGTAGGAAARPVVDLSFLGDLPADALDWGCGKLPSAPFPTVLTLGKPFAELVPLVWMLESTQLPGTGLAKIDKKFAPPFVQVRDDFTPHVSDALTALAQANPASSQLSPLDLLRGQNVEVKIVEVSFLTDLSTDLAQTEKSTYGLYVTIGGETKLVAAGYDGRLWLQEASLLQTRPQTSAAASAGDTQISATEPSPRPAEAVADEAVQSDAPEATTAVLAAGPLAAGDLVTLDAGLPTAEVVQVRDVQGQTVRLTTPLRHGHAAGEMLYVVARRAVGLPERPVAFAPYDSAAATARPLLQWAMLAPASTYDVQIARDTFFVAPLAQEHAALRADSLRLSGLAEGQRYAWRVRARSEVGVGPWSRPRTFVTSTPVASEGAAVAPSSEVTLSPPTPNPASGRASLAFALPVAEAVRVSVYDLLGREVAVLVDEVRAAGRHEAVVPASSLPPGVYVVRLVAGRERQTQRLVVVH